MADFRINNQYGRVFQQAETIHNQGMLTGADTQEVEAWIRALVAELDARLVGGELEEAVALPVRAALLDAAETEVEADRTSALGRARALAAGTVMLAGLVESIDQLVALFTGG